MFLPESKLPLNVIVDFGSDDDNDEGFPHSSAGKKSACNAGYPGFNSWVGKIPWRRDRLPTTVFWPGEFLGLYSPWNGKELDMTEQFSLSL